MGAALRTTVPVPTPLSITLAVVLTVLSGLLHGAAFPPRAHAAVAWVALVPWLIALTRRSAIGAASLGVVWGVTAAWSVGEWMPTAIVRYFGQPWPVGALGFLTCAIVTVAPYTAAFAVVFHRIDRRAGFSAPLLVAAAWVATEFARATLPFGNPWCLLGYSQVDSVSILHAASWGGIFAISGAVALANATLAALWISRGRAERASVITMTAIPCVLLAAFTGHGAWAVAQAPPNGAAATPSAVAIVQANLDLGAQWRPEMFGENLGQQLDLTYDITSGMTHPLVIWPESALTFFLEREASYRSLIAATLRATDAQLVTGGPRTLPGPHRDEARYINAAFLLGADGQISGIYEKRDLLPFAEYFPLPALDFLRRHFGRVREFSRGQTQKPLHAQIGRLGILICNEAFYGPNARSRVREGAGLLISLANDSWVGDVDYATIAGAMTRVRAVETDRWLVRASTSGPSMIIDPDGRVAAAAPLGTSATLRGAVDTRASMTAYVRCGDAFAWLCVVVTLWALRRRPE